MEKFGLLPCTLMICVSDQNCMNRCEKAGFPCFDFQYLKYHPELSKLPHALEQIGEFKLLHIPKALARGVNVLMLDLDVGFLASPLKLLEHMSNKEVDVYVQKDLSFVMNRSLEGWRTWYTVPLPNIGVFYCRGNDKTYRMFDIAWKDYKAIDKPIKHNPGKDQNKVVGAMHTARSFGLRWRYIPEQTATLLDKVYKFDDPSYELGGEAAEAILNRKGSTVVHTTCYEQKAKVMGLKAANAFWNPNYYDPQRRTITKPLLYLTEDQLRHELRALLYLGMVTNRSVIIPNMLGNEKHADVRQYKGMALWPGFRIAFFLNKMFDSRLNIVEPAYYWRIERDYPENAQPLGIPHPTLVHLKKSELKRLKAVEDMLLLAPDLRDAPRIVLNIVDTDNVQETEEGVFQRVLRWAQDSVGVWESYETESARYAPLPRLNCDMNKGHSLRDPKLAYDLVHYVRLCENIFVQSHRGNRSCFDKCD